jgi:sRNA-binding regulator protein Hfq
MEARIGRRLAELTRPEARDWIKKLRSIADEIAPSQKVHYGAWPEAHEDREAAYLRQQRDASARFTFKLFNGEQFDGTLVDFTPYTITIRLDGGEEEVVLRKLAIAYYRRIGQGDAAAATPSNFVTANLGDEQLVVPATAEAAVTPAETAPAAVPTAEADDRAQDDQQPPVTDVDSGRTEGTGATEEESMGEGRGAQA